MLRRGRRGRKYLACSAYPRCRNIMGLDRQGRPVKLPARVNTGFACPRCGEQMHAAPDNPDELACGRCRHRVPLLTVEEALKATEIPADSPLATCPDCGGPMQIRRSRRGLFLGCVRYPECKGTSPLPKDALPAPQPTRERCDKCGRPLVMRWGQYGRFLACSGFPRCRNSWQIPQKLRPCPAEGCGGHLIKKVSQDGTAYLGCTRFPDCEHTEPAPVEKRSRDKKAPEAE